MFLIYYPLISCCHKSRAVLTTYLTAYKQHTKMDDKEVLVTNPKKRKERSLEKSVVAEGARHVVRRIVVKPETREKKDLVQNIYVERKYRKYERRLIAMVIKKVIERSEGV